MSYFIGNLREANHLYSRPCVERSSACLRAYWLVCNLSTCVHQIFTSGRVDSGELLRAEQLATIVATVYLGLVAIAWTQRNLDNLLALMTNTPGPAMWATCFQVRAGCTSGSGGEPLAWAWSGSLACRPALQGSTTGPEAVAVAQRACVAPEPGAHALLHTWFLQAPDWSLYHDVDMTSDPHAVSEMCEDEEEAREKRFCWELAELCCLHHVCGPLSVPFAEGGLGVSEPAVPSLLRDMTSPFEIRQMHAIWSLATLKPPAVLSDLGASLQDDVTAWGPTQGLFRIRALQPTSANPFSTQKPRRLWHFLVSCESLQETMVRAIFQPPSAEVKQGTFNEFVTLERFGTEALSLDCSAAANSLVVATSAGLVELRFLEEDSDEDSEVGGPLPSAGRARRVVIPG